MNSRLMWNSAPDVTVMRGVGDFQKHAQFQQSFNFCAIMVEKNAGLVVIGYQNELQLHVFMSFCVITLTLTNPLTV